MTPSLCDTFNITDASLQERLAFIRLDGKDRATLAAHADWAREVGPAVFRRFYDWQFACPGTAAFFGRQAERMGIGLGALRTALEKAQVEFFVGIFTGAQQGFPRSWFENRLRVGQTHDRINLPVKYYIGSYSELYFAAKEQMRRTIRNPFRRARLADALFKALNLDQQAVFDSYMMSVLASMGVRVGELPCDPQQERTDLVGDAKGQIAALIRELSGSVDHIASSVDHLTAVAHELQDTADAVASSTEEMSASIHEVSNNSCRAAEEAAEGVEQGNQAMQVMGVLQHTSAAIGEVVQLIQRIANQTNLLALNATVEAARAGDAGRGFAVVAGEVKELASRSATATGEIEERIREVQAGAKDAAEQMQRIQQKIQTIHDGETSVAAAVEQQSSVVRNVSESAQMTAEGANQTRETAGKLQGIAKGLTDMVHRFAVTDVGTDR